MSVLAPFTPWPTWLLLRLIIAGAGCSAPDLAAQLLYQFGVLLLHLLGKLLAPRVPTTAQGCPGVLKHPYSTLVPPMRLLTLG